MNFIAVIVVIIGVFGLAYSIINYTYWTSFNEPVNNPTVENRAPLQMPTISEEELKKSQESPFNKCMEKYGDNWTSEQYDGCRRSTAGTND
jgi:hypothetical protein